MMKVKTPTSDQLKRRLIKFTVIVTQFEMSINEAFLSLGKMVSGSPWRMSWRSSCRPWNIACVVESMGLWVFNIWMVAVWNDFQPSGNQHHGLPVIVSQLIVMKVSVLGDKRIIAPL